jgi:CubicO group peptidase (beta-lactamase class C family)
MAHTMCSEVFISGLKPSRIFSESFAPTPTILTLDPFISYDVDYSKKEVHTAVFGFIRSRAIFRPGLGCTLVYGENLSKIEVKPVVSQPKESDPFPMLAIPTIQKPASPLLEKVLDRMFKDDPKGVKRNTRAVVIIQKEKIIAERYAQGINPSTPLIGYSMTKSFTNAMLGVLVRQNKLDITARAPVAEWSSSSDPRRSITTEHLMRMTSGLDINEDYTGGDATSKMLYQEPDMAAFAKRSKLKFSPGSSWQYTSGNTMILSSIIRNAVGGKPEDINAFVRRELLEPLHMSSAVLESDNAGTPIGSTYLLASARDWARLGLLYLHDGKIGSKRILPEGWVKNSVKETLNKGYGAGFWVRSDTSAKSTLDFFWAEGVFGQQMLIIPAYDMVIVRIGPSALDEDSNIKRLIEDVFGAK